MTILGLTKTNVKGRLLMVGFGKRYRSDHAAAEAHVDEKGLVCVGGLHEQTQVIGMCDVTAFGAHYCGGYTRNVESDLRQSPTEQPILFVAPSTALLQDDLFVSGGRVRGQSRPKLHIKVLERHTLYVMCQQLAEYVQHWRWFVVE
jgi:hypothetical protein